MWKTTTDPLARPPIKNLKEQLQHMKREQQTIFLLSLLLVVRQRKRSDAAVAGWVGVQQGQVEGAPHLDDATIAASHQVFAVPGQQQALKI